MSEPNKSLKFLVADRDESVSKALRENLVGMGHHVTVVKTGEEAFEEVKSRKYDAAILDVTFPDQVDGYNILQWIREDEAVQDMWVGLTSEMADRFREGSGLPFQPNEWVTKPIIQSELESWTFEK